MVNIVSREILFRAWHTVAKQMCYNVTTDLFDRKYLIFMQYIGITEGENVGEKIYEGDLVTIYPFSDEVYEVKWDKCGFILVGIEDGNIAELFTPYGHQRLFNIIGNIHQGIIK